MIEMKWQYGIFESKIIAYKTKIDANYDERKKYKINLLIFNQQFAH